MQNREDLRKKATMEVEKRCVARGGKISFSEGGGINKVFGPKYRPLLLRLPFALCANRSLLFVVAKNRLEVIHLLMD
jgi:hypothetical protein